MSKTTLKRLPAPASWPIKRKEYKLVVKTSSGTHPMERSLPALVLVRDILKLTDIAREAINIIAKGNMLIDNRVIKDYRFPVGLMDTVQFPVITRAYRMMIDGRGMLVPVEISAEEAKWKLSRIEKKITTKKGKFILTMFDGRNMLLDKANEYSTRDVLKIELPSQKIVDLYKFKEGNVAYVWKGKNAGRIGTISKLEVSKSGLDNLVYFKEGFVTSYNNVYVAGKSIPDIRLPEVVANE